MAYLILDIKDPSFYKHVPRSDIYHVKKEDPFVHFNHWGKDAWETDLTIVPFPGMVIIEIENDKLSMHDLTEILKKFHS